MVECSMKSLIRALSHHAKFDHDLLYHHETPLGVHKVSMFNHTYPHKPLREIKVTICDHQADSSVYVWTDVWPGDSQVLKKYGHTWHRMSLLRPGVIKQHKTNQTKPNQTIMKHKSINRFLSHFCCALLIVQCWSNIETLFCHAKIDHDLVYHMT